MNALDPWISAMATGDFAAAWKISDRVLAAHDPAGRDDPAQPYHERWVWDGRPFDGRSVLVRCYHGLGDTLQFCRYLPALRRRVRHLTLETQPELIPLLEKMSGPQRIVPFDPVNPLPPDECDLEIMELAFALRLPPETTPYLAIPDRMTDGGLGLCWRSGTGWQPERSIPDATMTAFLDQAPCRFVSLQQGAYLPGITDDCPATILETAQRIAGLEAVITVDTMIAHLAGALGIPVCLLLPEAPDWRWLAGGTGSIWYGQVRKYRQTTQDDWATPLAALSRDLTRRTEAGTLPVGVGM